MHFKSKNFQKIITFKPVDQFYFFFLWKIIYCSWNIYCCILPRSCLQDYLQWSSWDFFSQIFSELLPKLFLDSITKIVPRFWVLSGILFFNGYPRNSFGDFSFHCILGDTTQHLKGENSRETFEDILKKNISEKRSGSTGRKY